MYGAGVGVYGNSGYAYTGSTPSKLKKRIEEANSSNAEITDINITENGNYVIILGGSGYWTLGYPDAFLKKLEQYRTGDLRDDNILSACFNDRGEWVVITDKHYSYSNETIKNFILKAEELYEEVYYAYITNYGMIACCKNGVYYKNIPSNLAEALKKLTFKPKVIKFTDNGLYLITDGESQNYYFRFSSVRLNRLRNKLLANYLKSGGNELATVRISAFCVAMLSNNSFICKYSIFFRKYELSAAVL